MIRFKYVRGLVGGCANNMRQKFDKRVFIDAIEKAYATIYINFLTSIRAFIIDISIRIAYQMKRKYVY